MGYERDEQDERSYPAERTKVTITYMDGEVEEYVISAGVGVARYLADTAGQTGVLSLHDWGMSSMCVPLTAIRNWRLDKVQ